MKTILRTSLFIAFLLIGNFSFAQEEKTKTEDDKPETVGEVFEKGAERRAEEKKEELNNKRGKDYRKKPTVDLTPRLNEAEVNDILRITTGQDKAKIRDTYTFPLSITTETQDLIKRKQKINSITQIYGDEAMVLMMENDQLLLSDFNSNTAIMINEKDKMAQVMSLEFMGKMMGKGVDLQNKNENHGKEPSITKTGNSKKIAGYNAEEYIAESEDGKTHVWITNEIDYNFSEAVSGMMNIFGAKFKSIEVKGYPLEMLQKDEKGTDTFKMLVTEISTTPKTIKMADYKVMRMFGN